MWRCCVFCEREKESVFVADMPSAFPGNAAGFFQGADGAIYTSRGLRGLARQARD